MEYQPGRLKPCSDCGQDVDTWLSGTTAAMTTPRGIVCGWCYSENGMNLDLMRTGDLCPRCGLSETDTDRCGPLYCPLCKWQSASCEHEEAPVPLDSVQRPGSAPVT